MTQMFLNTIQNNSFRMIEYPTIEKGIESIQKAETWLVIGFQEKFTKNFKRRFLKPDKVTEKIINGSKIELYPDNSHTFNALFTMRTLLDTFEKFIKEVGVSMGYNPRFFGAPIDIMEPIYGSLTDIKFGEYVMPGMIMCMVHAMSMLIGSFTVVQDKNSGHMERGFVVGIKPIEVIGSYMSFYILPIASQVILVMILLFYVYQQTIQGSYFLTFLLAFLHGFQGFVMGLTISTVCNTVVESMVSHRARPSTCAIVIFVPLADAGHDTGHAHDIHVRNILATGEFVRVHQKHPSLESNGHAHSSTAQHHSAWLGHRQFACTAWLRIHSGLLCPFTRHQYRQFPMVQVITATTYLPTYSPIHPLSTSVANLININSFFPKFCWSVN